MGNKETRYIPFSTETKVNLVGLLGVATSRRRRACRHLYQEMTNVVWVRLRYSDAKDIKA